MGGLTNDVRRFWWAVLAIALLTIVTRLPSLLARRLLDRYPDLFIAFTGAPAEATANN